MPSNQIEDESKSEMSRSFKILISNQFLKEFFTLMIIFIEKEQKTPLFESNSDINFILEVDLLLKDWILIPNKVQNKYSVKHPFYLFMN